MDVTSYDLLCAKMQADWDRRARENYRHYIVNSREEWSAADFVASGQETCARYIATDMTNVCQGRDPADLRVLDFGCGAGRVTGGLARLFGEVYGVDISSEMIARARNDLRDLPNVTLVQSNGRDLSALGDLQFDFAFAFSVFHHVPSKEIIESCIREVGAHLRPGALFKFEVQGCLGWQAAPDDTWLGAAMSESDMLEIANRTGFEYRYKTGTGEESFWQWFFKR
jgi:SAM-dependent methyltransferase